MILIIAPEDAKKVFKRNAKYIWRKASKLLQWTIDAESKYEGCYVSPTRPRKEDFHDKIEVPKGSTFLNEFTSKVVRPWEEANPEEVAKEKDAIAKRDDEFCKMRNSIYSIADKLGLFVTWGWENQAEPDPGKWLIYKKGKNGEPGDLIAIMKVA